MKIYVSVPFDSDASKVDANIIPNYIKALQTYYKDVELELLHLTYDQATGDQGEAIKIAVEYMNEAELICFCPYYNDGSRCNRSEIEYRIATTIYSEKVINATMMQNILADYRLRPTVTTSLVNERIRDVPEDTLVYVRVGNTDLSVAKVIDEPFKSGLSRIIMVTRPDKNMGKCTKNTSSISQIVEKINEGENKND